MKKNIAFVKDSWLGIFD